MHLTGKAQPAAPAWEPEQGWRVLTPDLQQVAAGGQTILHVSVEFTHTFSREFGVDGNQLPLLGGSRA